MPRQNKKYTPELKIQVIETKIKEKLSSYEAAKKFNITIIVNGCECPAHNYVLKWEKIYLKEGPEGFYVERRGRGTTNKGRKPNFNPQNGEDLITKCKRLEMENEYLKKLSALVSARERKEKK